MERVPKGFCSCPTTKFITVPLSSCPSISLLNVMDILWDGSHKILVTVPHGFECWIRWFKRWFRLNISYAWKHNLLVRYKHNAVHLLLFLFVCNYIPSSFYRPFLLSMLPCPTEPAAPSYWACFPVLLNLLPRPAEPAVTEPVASPSEPVASPTEPVASPI